jgi:methyltransferase (TIGR00027 family)
MNEDKPSDTALGVAYTILALSAGGNNTDLVSEEYVDKLSTLMKATGNMSSSAITLCRTRFGSWMVRRTIDRRFPDQSAQFGRRKLYFERQARQAVSAGARQVLVLGAGYDLLCIRLASEYPDVSWIEIDHPATASAKRRGLEALGMPPNVFQVPVDLSQKPLYDVLKSQKWWNESSCSFITAEGLTQYLTRDLVKTLFHTIGSLSGASSRFAFTFVGWSDEKGRPDMGPLTEKLQAEFERRGEPWLWGTSAESLPEFLQDTPWKLMEGVIPAGIESFACAVKK